MSMNISQPINADGEKWLSMIGTTLKQTKDLITDNKLNDFYRQLGKPIQIVKKNIDVDLTASRQKQ